MTYGNWDPSNRCGGSQVESLPCLQFHFTLQHLFLAHCVAENATSNDSQPPYCKLLNVTTVLLSVLSFLWIYFLFPFYSISQIQVLQGKDKKDKTSDTAAVEDDWDHCPCVIVFVPLEKFTKSPDQYRYSCEDKEWMNQNLLHIERSDSEHIPVWGTKHCSPDLISELKARPQGRSQAQIGEIQ